MGKVEIGMDTRLIRFTKNLLDIMFVFGMIVTIGIPLIFYYVGFYIEKFRKYYLAQCTLYIISGILCLMIMIELRKMLSTVLKNNAFVWENALSLKKMGKCSFLIAIISVIRLIISFTPATVVIILGFLIAGLFCFVLCQVFGQAVQYKEENDLTI